MYIILEYYDNILEYKIRFLRGYTRYDNILEFFIDVLQGAKFLYF